MDRYIDELIARYPILKKCRNEICSAYQIMEQCYRNGGKLLIAGNGGSASDAEHIVGELMKRFKQPRPISQEFAQKLRKVDLIRGSELAQNLECSLKAISLVSQESLLTAYINDVDDLGVYAQQVFGYGEEKDVFLGISTSGNSENIIRATIVAKAIGMKTIALAGASGGRLSEISDVVVRVPEIETYKIQELHLPVYHCWCMMLEEKFFGESKEK